MFSSQSLTALPADLSVSYHFPTSRFHSSHILIFDFVFGERIGKLKAVEKTTVFFAARLESRTRLLLEIWGQDK